MKRVNVGAALAVAAILVGCATSSGVMDYGDGTFAIVTHSSLIRGGISGATRRAYLNAQKFCSKHQPRSHVVVVAQSSGAAGSISLGGDSDLRFRCAT